MRALHQANQLNAFRVKLADALRFLTDATEIQAIAARILGESLGATRVIYIEVVSDGEQVIVHCNYTNGVAQLSGRYRLEDYRRNLTADHEAGRTQVVTDIPNNPKYTDEEKARYREIDIAAHIDVPLIKNNQFVALLAVHQSTPRQWTQTEVKLVEETAERTWAAVERASAEAALRVSEEKYRTLFESIDQGFCLLEVLFDPDEKPFDYRFVEINEAFEQQSGLTNAVGKTILELVPNLEPQSAELYGQVVKSGEAIRFEADVASMNRFFDIYAFPSGAPGQNLVAVLFADITQRKRREANLAFLAEIQDDCARLTTADAMMQTIGAKIGEYLHLSVCAFVDIDEAQDRAIVPYSWHREDAPNVTGTYRISEFLSEAFHQEVRAGKVVVVNDTTTDARTDAASHAALNLYSFISVPFLRDGQWKFLLNVADSRPRDWREDEIELFCELANRIFPRLERARAEAALRESEQQFRLMADAVPQIVWITDVQGRVEFFNKQWSDYTGVPYEPTTAAEVAANFVHPEDGDRTMEAFNEARRSGGVFSVEHRIRSAAGTYRWFLVRAEPYRDPQTSEIVRWFGASIDIHDRKRREANLAFLAEIQDDCARLTTADAMMQTIGAKIGEYLHLSVCAFVDIDEAQDRAIVPYTWHRADVPNLVGTYRISEFVSEEFYIAARAGEVFVVNDTNTDARTDAENCAALNIQSFIHVPFLRDGQWKFLLNVYDSRPRDWREDEIELFSELANRIFPRLERARAEAALRDSEERYRSLVMATSSIVWVAAGNGEILSAPEWEAFTGQTPEQYKGWGWFEMVHPDDREHTIRLWTHGIENKIPCEVEHRLLHRDGQYRHTVARAVPILDDAGNVREWVGTVTDITEQQAALRERKLAEAALQKSEERYRFLVTTTSSMIWVANSEGEITEDVPWWQGFTGQSPEQYKGYGWLDVIHPDDRPQTIENWTQAQQTKTPVTSEYRLRRHDGQYRYMLSQGVPILDSQGNVREWMGSLIDIDDRKQAEAIILQREAQFRQLADAIPQQVWITDAQGNTQYVNQQWTTYTGLTLEQTQDIHYATQVIHPDDFEMTSELWRTALATGTPYQAEFRLKHDADNTYRWFLSRAIAIRDEQGQIVQWFGTSTDIEEFRRAQAQREQLLQREQTAREAAENANRIKDEFLAVLSHELRSPLNPILGWSRLLQQGKLDAAKTKTALATIERNAQLQVQLIDDLLDISRILRGKLTLNVMPVNLSTVISEALETVRLAAQAKSLQIKTTISPDVGAVMGDAGRLQQVVWNLLSNAVKFTPSGGQVKVNLKRLQIEDVRLQIERELQIEDGRLQISRELQIEDGRLQISRELQIEDVRLQISRELQIEDGRLQIEDENPTSNLQSEILNLKSSKSEISYAQIQVIDTGKGINTEFLPYVFEHFRQEDGATTRKFGGLGLGLAIARQIVEMHGGTIAVDSPGEGRGATFTVLLPLAPDLSQPPSQERSSASTDDLNGIRILVVDDDTDSREFVTFVLEQAGATVTSVSSGREALQAYAQKVPDLIVSDIGMPQMDGYMLMREIRAQQETKQVPAIALTAYAGEFDRQQALKAGFSQHIPKPVEPSEIITIVARLCDRNKGTNP